MIATKPQPPAPPEADAEVQFWSRWSSVPEQDDEPDARPVDARVWADVAAELAE